MAVPVWVLKHSGLVPVALQLILTNASMVVLAEAEHPFASVTVTVYVPGIKPVTALVVAPSLHKYAYGAVPPPTIAMAVPLGFWQLIFVVFIPTVKSDGSLTAKLSVTEHGVGVDESVMVTVYAPAVNPLIEAVVADEPPLHTYVYGPVPPTVVVLMAPVAKPKHVTLVTAPLACSVEFCPIIMQRIAVHPMASVTVT